METTVQEAFDALVAQYGADAVITAIKGHVHPDSGSGCKSNSDCPTGYYCNGSQCVLNVGG